MSFLLGPIPGGLPSAYATLPGGWFKLAHGQYYPYFGLAYYAPWYYVPQYAAPQYAPTCVPCYPLYYWRY